MRARRPILSLLAVALSMVALCAAQAALAAAPAGPRLASVELIESQRFRGPLGDPDPTMALATIDPATGKERRFLRASLDAPGRVVPVPFRGLAWLADGSRIAFSGHDGHADKDGIYLVADGGDRLRLVPGTSNGSDPVISPDGRTLAFSRLRYRSHIPKDFFENPFAGIRVFSSTTSWIVDLAAGKPRRLTPWKNHLHNTPTSFSPDGTTLLLTREDGNRESPRVMRMDLAGGSAAPLLGRAQEAVYSPDGSRLAFTGFLHPDVVEAEENHDYLAPELYLANADGGSVKRLSHSEGVLESFPAWDPSGQRLAYIQFRADTSWTPGLANLFPTGNALMRVNADGSCRRKILSRPSIAFYGVTWQPGPGREAGPSACR